MYVFVVWVCGMCKERALCVNKNGVAASELGRERAKSKAFEEDNVCVCGVGMWDV